MASPRCSNPPLLLEYAATFTIARHLTIRTALNAAHCRHQELARVQEERRGDKGIHNKDHKLSVSCGKFCLAKR
ncbi:hypothetical protein [Oryza sativa Japonica Group]|uniref:Uncharacterized protein n=1 Tax=Oryza sativa subsp. japonica TaxID=39947 RepID=Q9FP49_ORYSJ|nr:hypothetical protein [Oryza sativa Japonica Group]